LSENQNSQTRETRYLLGKLTEEEAIRFEEHYFADDAAFEEIGIAEDELIDAYVRGELSSADRKQFQKNLVSSERLRERVEFAGILSSSTSSSVLPLVIDKQPPAWWRVIFAPSFTDRPAIRIALAASVIVVLAGSVALVVETRKLHNESGRLQTERAALEQQKQDLVRQISDEQSRANQFAAELQTERSAKEKLNQELQDTRDQLAKFQPPTSLATASILLFSGLSRDSNARKELVAPAGATTLELKLALDTDEYDKYRVSIQSADGREVFSKDQMKANGPRSARTILCRVSSNRLAPGGYVVKVNGRTSSGTYDSVADYAFRLSRK
jgi:hypothetical protein